MKILSKFMLMFSFVLICFTHGEDGLEFGTYYALIIANQNYEEWEKLKTPHNDAKRLKSVLQKKYGFKVTTLLDATRDQVIEALEDYNVSLGPNDNLLIYYAGHGQYQANLGYWIGTDGDLRRRTKWISGYSLTPLISEIKSRHILVVSDSCYAGTVFRDSSLVRENIVEGNEYAWIKTTLSSRSRTALVSGTLEPVIDHLPNSNHSLFAEAFISALENNNKVIDGNAIFELIKKKVIGTAERYLPYNVESQVPSYNRIRGAEHQKGDFLFLPNDNKIKFQIADIQEKENINYGIRTKDKENSALVSTSGIKPTTEEIRLFSEGKTSYHKNNYNQTISIFKSFMHEYPKSNNMSEAYYYLAESYYKQGYKDKALSTYAELVSKFPSSSEAELAKLRTEMIQNPNNKNNNLSTSQKNNINSNKKNKGIDDPWNDLYKQIYRRYDKAEDNLY